MNFDILVTALGWISVINFSVLFLWFLVFVFAKTWYYNLTSNWFTISEEKFDVIHYSLMGIFELFVIAFFLAPYLALKIFV